MHPIHLYTGSVPSAGPPQVSWLNLYSLDSSSIQLAASIQFPMGSVSLTGHDVAQSKISTSTGPSIPASVILSSGNMHFTKLQGEELHA